MSRHQTRRRNEIELDKDSKCGCKKHEGNKSNCRCSKDKCKGCDKIVIIQGDEITTESYEITSPGVYYLCGDIVWTGPNDSQVIVIRSSDVVLNLKGFSIRDESNALRTVAIFVEPARENVVIQNGTIRGFGAVGVRYETNTKNGKVDGMRFLQIGGRGGLPLPYGGVSLASIVNAGISVAGQNLDNFRDDEPETRGFVISNNYFDEISSEDLNVLVAGISLTGLSDYTVENNKIFNIIGSNTARGLGASNTKRFNVIGNSTSRVVAGDGTAGLSVNPSAYGSITNNKVVGNSFIEVEGLIPSLNRLTTGIACSNSLEVVIDGNITQNTFVPQLEGYRFKQASAVLTRGADKVVVRNHIDTGTHNQFYDLSFLIADATPALSYDHRSLPPAPPSNIDTAPFEIYYQNVVSVGSDIGIQLDGRQVGGLNKAAIVDTKILFSRFWDLRTFGTVNNLQLINDNFRNMSTNGLNI